MLERRSLLAGLATALCAPAVIRTPGLLMRVSAPKVSHGSLWIVGGSAAIPLYGVSPAAQALADMEEMDRLICETWLLPPRRLQPMQSCNTVVLRTFSGIG